MGVNIEGMVVELDEISAEEAAKRIMRGEIELVEDHPDGGGWTRSPSESNQFTLIDFKNSAVIILGSTRSFLYNRSTRRIGDSDQLKDFLKATNSKGAAFAVSDIAMRFYFRWYENGKRTRLTSFNFDSPKVKIGGEDYFNFLENERDISTEILPELIMEFSGRSFQEVWEAPFKIYEVIPSFNPIAKLSTKNILERSAKRYIEEIGDVDNGDNTSFDEMKTPGCSMLLNELEKRKVKFNYLFKVSEVVAWGNGKQAVYLNKNGGITSELNPFSTAYFNYQLVHQIYMNSFDNKEKAEDFFTWWIGRSEKDNTRKNDGGHVNAVYEQSVWSDAWFQKLIWIVLIGVGIAALIFFSINN